MLTPTVQIRFADAQIERTHGRTKLAQTTNTACTDVESYNDSLAVAGVPFYTGDGSDEARTGHFTKPPHFHPATDGVNEHRAVCVPVRMRKVSSRRHACNNGLRSCWVSSVFVRAIHLHGEWAGDRPNGGRVTTGYRWSFLCCAPESLYMLTHGCCCFFPSSLHFAQHSASLLSIILSGNMSYIYVVFISCDNNKFRHLCAVHNRM